MQKPTKKFLREWLVKGQQGLSLMEILIALTILGIAGTFITTRVMKSLEEGQIRSAQIQLQNVKAALENYRRHCGKYPTSEQGLEALTTKPTTGPECKRYQNGGYVEKLEMDPWDHDFIYESDGNKITVLKSLGPTGEEGAENEVTLETKI